MFLLKRRVENEARKNTRAHPRAHSYEFQIDLGIAILNRAITLEWEDIDGPRPNRMHKNMCVPSECKKCFFCINKLTRRQEQPSLKKLTPTCFRKDVLTRG